MDIESNTKAIVHKITNIKVLAAHFFISLNY